MAEGGYPNKIKRPCLEDVTLSLGPCAHSSNPCAELQAPPLAMNPGSAGPPLLLETNPLNSGALDSPLVVPLAADMGLKGPAGPYYDRVSSMPPVDQELRDLLEELTKIPEPSCSELDLEKILGRKPEEPLLLDQPQVPTQMPHLGSLASREELASSCSHAVGVSLPMPPCSAGLGYSRPSTSGQVPSPSSSTAQAENQGPATIPVALAPPPVPQWRHAQQLKALAASKQGSATRSHRPAASWSGLPPLGPSPPSRPAPSQQPPPPFSSQNLLASCMSPGASLSSMASGRTSALGPNVPYAPEKLPQPPPLSPQSAILASLMASPTSNPGPSPPYGPEQRCSPGLPQQSFTPQCNSARALAAAGGPLRPLSPLRPQPPAPPASASSKALSTSPAKTLSMIVRQGLAGPSPAAPEPFPFGSTKPLSHFVSEPGPEKAPSMPSMPAASRQPSLLHYLQQPTPAQSPAAIATATAILEQQPPSDRSALLLQQMVQQSQCLPRAAALDAMPSLSRQACCHLFAWSSAASSLERRPQHWSSLTSRQDPQPGDASSPNITHVDKACKLGEARPPQASLRRQPPSCQALGSESFLPGSSFAQELARVTSSHSDSEVASWGGWDLKAWRQAPAPPLPSCDAAAREAELRSSGNDP
ncbi:mastermind-like domain-containing protein 1 isoform X2 [Tamandua tetradactyla]|uniref:mastermind-like domain-containing protein 1 isoform X2 n=1 Tax=Tamandua tetradactyla TaxID=48850 RepID=UPI00405457DA